MSDQSTIEWTDATWNPVTGCTKVSPGCDHCYADTFAERWRGTPGHYFENGFDVQLRPDKLDQPLRWKKPRRIFVNSMSDLFHKDVPDEYIVRVFAVMAMAKQHTFQILTKRHARLRAFLRDECRCGKGHAPGVHLRSAMDWAGTPHSPTYVPGVVGGEVYHQRPWPLPNVQIGVSVEDQKWADIRIPALLDTPAAVRFISAEPLLGPVDLWGPLDGSRGRPKLTYWLDGRPGWGPEKTTETGLVTQSLTVGPRLDWVIVGGESGPGARPMHPDWARSLRDQCVASGVPYLFKQWGVWCPPHPDQGQSIFGHVTNEDACQVVTMGGALRGRPWPGWGIQDGTRDAVVMRRYGKKAAGRLLDGRTWDEFPQSSPSQGGTA